MAAAEKSAPPGKLLALTEDLLKYLRYARQNALLAGGKRAAPSSEQQDQTDKKSPGDSLQMIADEVLKCTRCRLCQSRTTAVPGEGAERTDLMVIGEGPGRMEDTSGRPFVGEAGQMLTRMLAAIGEPRPTVFITNIVKCRPPFNRNPSADEIESCRPYLDRQIARIEPMIILALGKVSAQNILHTEKSISRLRGEIYHRNNLEILPTFHPAYLLRNPDGKKLVWEDLKLLKSRLEELRKKTTCKGSSPS